MDMRTELKRAENILIHGRSNTRKDLTVYDLADHVNKSHNYLCRIASTTEDLPFPIEIAVKIMQLKKRYELLELIAWRCGFALVKLPRAKLKKEDENEICAEYQRSASEAVSAVLRFFQESTPESFSACEESLKNVVQESLNVRKTAEKKAAKQLELF